MKRGNKTNHRYKYENIYIKMPLHSLLLIPYGDKNIFTRISNEDVERVSKYRWRPQRHHTGRYYTHGQVNNKTIQLHRFITNCPVDKVVDHINRDSLDNRRSNLRCVTVEENNNNRGKYSNVSKETGIQGISVLYRVRIVGYKDRYFNSLERAKYYYQEIMEDKCTDKKR